MGLIDDILKGLPENALLRAQMRELADKLAALETENAILKDTKRDLERKVVSLTNEMDDLKHIDTLEEIERNILVYVAQNRDSFHHDIALSVGISEQQIEYYLQELVTKGYVEDRFGYPLTQKGRKYLMDNNLL